MRSTQGLPGDCITMSRRVLPAGPRRPWPRRGRARCYCHRGSWAARHPGPCRWPEMMESIRPVSCDGALYPLAVITITALTGRLCWEVILQDCCIWNCHSGYILPASQPVPSHLGRCVLGLDSGCLKDLSSSRPDDGDPDLGGRRR